MAMRQGTCPECLQHVEFQVVLTGNMTALKCSNCWAYLDKAGVGKLEALTGALENLAAQRRKLIEDAR